MTEEKLSWDNESDRLEIIKQLCEEFNSPYEGSMSIPLGKIMSIYMPWMIERIEQFEKKKRIKK